MDPQRFTTRPKKARTWLRTREVERLRLHRLQLDIQALHAEIRTLTTTRSLLLAREDLAATVHDARPHRLARKPTRTLHRHTTDSCRERIHGSVAVSLPSHRSTSLRMLLEVLPREPSSVA